MKNFSVKRLSLMAVMTAMAMIFSYVETLIPIPIPVPGVRLGLANLIILLMLLTAGPLDAFLVGLLRILLSAVLFGNIFSFSMSMMGFLISFCVMALLLKSRRFSVPGVSAAGGIFHNTGQLLAACLILKSTGILAYTEVFVLLGMATGLITGFLCKMIHERTKHHDWLSER